MENNILQYPNTVLTTPCEFITDEHEARKLAQQLLQAYMALPNTRVGLAANQVGLTKHMAIIMGDVRMNLTFEPVNQVSIEREGCFSLEYAREQFMVSRPKYGWATWMDPYTFEKKEAKLKGLEARVFQHELDHLQGKLCNR